MPNSSYWLLLQPEQQRGNRGEKEKQKYEKIEKSKAHFLNIHSYLAIRHHSFSSAFGACWDSLGRIGLVLPWALQKSQQVATGRSASVYQMTIEYRANYIPTNVSRVKNSDCAISYRFSLIIISGAELRNCPFYLWTRALLTTPATAHCHSGSHYIS
ncbi:hypothetical protein HCH54_004482 [Aspergillus fumigatus]